MKIKRELVLIIILIFLILEFLFNINLFVIKTYCQETISIFDYLTEEQILIFILYADEEDIINFAKSYGIDTKKEVKNIRIELLKFFNLNYENLFIEDKHIILIKKADYLYTKNYEEENITIVKLIGNIYIYFDNKIISADKIIFEVKNQQFIATGNVVFIDGKSIYYASKVFFNLKTLTGIFYDVRGKVDNLWLIGEVFTKLTGKSFTGKNLKISTCDKINMHYYILSSNFFYSESVIISFNNTIFVGASPIFWLPIYINFDFGIGFPGEFGFLYRKREGFLFYNTFNIKDNFSFYFDIYEKLGVFSGLDYKSNNINILLGAGYSQVLFYNSQYDIWTPYNENLMIEKPIRLFRYGGKININYPLISNLINIGLNLEYYGDPYFNYDFLLRERKLDVDIGDFARTYYPSIFPSYTSSIEESINVNLNLRIFNISYRGKVSYSSYIKDELYIYTPYYLKYYKYFLNLYSFNLNFNLFNFNLGFFNLSSNISGSKSYSEIFNKEEEKISGYNYNSANVPFNLGLKLFNFFSFFINTNNSINYSESIDFKDNIINNKNSFYNFNLNASINFDFNYLKLRSSYSTNYIKMFYLPEISGWKSSILNNSVNINLFYNILVINLSNYINFFDNKTSNLFSFDLRRVSTVKYNLTFNPSKLFNFLYNGEYSIFYNLFLYSNYSLRFNIYNLNFFDFKVNITNSISYFQNLIDEFDTRFNNNFSFNISFKNEFSMSIIVDSFNEKFYTYDNFSELIIDLFKSFNFFNINDRKLSYFKLRTITISIKRDFHDFFGYFNLSGAYVYDSLLNGYFFKVVLSFGIQSINFNDLSFEDLIEKKY